MGELEQKKIASIIAKYINGTISSEEEVILNEWRQVSSRHEALLKRYCSEDFFVQMSNLYTPGEEKKLYRTIRKKIKSQNKSLIGYFLRVAAILLLLIVSSVTTYLLIPSNTEDSKSFSDLKPGNRQATLYLSNGETVAFSSTKRVLPINGTSNFIETDGKIISFPELKHNNDLLNGSNHIVVPRGGEYQLILTDQTSIYLNSESDMLFPTIFPDSLREVYFDGEAYFHIAADTAHPFIIHTFWGEVRVTGTEFNLRCYREEGELQLTLEKGIVYFRPNGRNEWQEVKVGNQLIYSATAKGCQISEVDTELYTSWRKGVYAFKSTPLKKIMSDLSRWYNIPVTYQNNELENITFTGEVMRYDNFDKIVKMLELTNTVHFEWRESKIHIIN